MLNEPIRSPVGGGISDIPHSGRPLFASKKRIYTFMAAVKNDHFFETNAYTQSAQGREWTSKMNIKYKIIIFIHFQQDKTA